MKRRLASISAGGLTASLLLGAGMLLFLVGCGGSPASTVYNQLPPSAGVIVTPSSATVPVGRVQQFTATVTPSGASQAVTWTVSGTGCTGASCGAIDATGKYTAPATVPNPPTVVVTARLAADPTKASPATVSIINLPSSFFSVNPASVAFDNQTVNTTSPPSTVTLTNTGSAAEPVSARMNGFNFGDFAQTNNCPPVIAAGASCTFSITFKPSATGGRIGYLVIDGNRDEEGIVSLTGTGIAATPSGCSPTGGTHLPTMAPNSVALAPDPTGKYGKFAYVANRYADCLSMYTIDSATGALTSIGTIPTGSRPISVAVDPSRKFVYVVNVGSNDVSTYSVDTTTGTLTSTGTIAAGSSPASVAVDPSGKFAYVANGSGVAMYTISDTAGGLASIGTIAAGAGLFSLSIAVDPSGRFVYVARPADTVGVAIGYVSMYTINTTNGTLTSTGSITAGVDPFSVAVDPSGRFAYVANLESGDISMYSINGTTGTLTSIGTNTTAFAPISVAAHPSGKFLYVANVNSNVSIYALNATTGVLTSIGTVAAGSSPSSIAIDLSGKFAYVTNFDSDDVSIFSIDAATGSLTLIGTVGT
jgi:6-phosphogluconolactonase (cycloisomerase 2 family)